MRSRTDQSDNLRLRWQVAYMRLTLLGVGAMNSPRYAPAGLLVEHRRLRVMLDGGPGAEPDGEIDAWLVTDERGELSREIRRLALARGLEPAVKTYSSGGVRIEPHRVVLTSHFDRGRWRKDRLGAGVLRVPTMGGGGRSDVRRGGWMEPSDPLQRRSRRSRIRARRRARGAATRRAKIGPGPHRATDDQGHRRRTSPSVWRARRRRKGLYLAPNNTEREMATVGSMMARTLKKLPVSR